MTESDFKAKHGFESRWGPHSVGPGQSSNQTDRLGRGRLHLGVVRALDPYRSFEQVMKDLPRLDWVLPQLLVPVLDPLVQRVA